MQPRHGRDDEDPTGVGESTNWVTEALGAVVPAAVARWAVTVDVHVENGTRVAADDADSESVIRLPVGEPVEFTVAIDNRLPAPVGVATPRLQLWQWAVDGEVEASDEPRRRSETSNELTLEAGETRRISRTWDGLFERTRGTRHRWVEPDPGRHTLSVAIQTEPPCARDSVTLDLVRR
ncbi:hypothetical protein RYH80_02790 [Halobaculum sp. MBLA0147]|uniref:hypothetical protein n=1 Tax=Halobaculum sp. MBLA0147 TaxID=3079934 RepID=UPI003523E8D4